MNETNQLESTGINWNQLESTGKDTWAADKLKFCPSDLDVVKDHFVAHNYYA